MLNKLKQFVIKKKKKTSKFVSSQESNEDFQNKHFFFRFRSNIFLLSAIINLVIADNGFVMGVKKISNIYLFQMELDIMINSSSRILRKKKASFKKN